MINFLSLEAGKLHSFLAGTSYFRKKSTFLLLHSLSFLSSILSGSATTAAALLPARKTTFKNKKA
jgi:hypothetical protein